MSWHQILGHDAVVDKFRQALRARKLASTFLFIGPPGIGKRTFAQKLAQSLLCEHSSDQELDACRNCPACQQVEASTHPDLIWVAKPEDKSFIPIELFIGDREHRMREGLCHEISLKPYHHGRRVAIIDDADYLNQEGANCLLKTLEEPPPQSLIILISTSEQRQLPTIRSRCQVVRFQPLSVEFLDRIIADKQLIEDPEMARRAARTAGGSLERAVELADPDVDAFRQHLLKMWSRGDWEGGELSASVSAFVDQAGKDAPQRRARMKQVFRMSAEFFRQIQRYQCGMPIDDDPPLQSAITGSMDSYSGDHEKVVACLDRCLDAGIQVDANANQATLLECWVDDLRQIQLGA